MKYKEMYYGNILRKKLLSGVEQLSKAVKATLGPKGRNVIINREFSSPVVTKDGVSVAKEILLKDKAENTGAEIAKEAALKTGEYAGDGTTTSIVLTEAFFKEGLRLVESGNNPIDVIRGMEEAKNDAVNYLNQIKVDVSDKKEIAQVATISANNDPELGSLIADAMEKTGKNGVITVEDGKGYDTRVDLEDGMQWDKGYLSPAFITNKENARFEADDAFLLIANKELANVAELLPIIEFCAQQQKPFVFMADDIKGELLATLAVNMMKSTIKCCAVKSPGFGEVRSHILEDIAITTGAKVINDVNLGGLKLENIGGVSRGADPRIQSDASLWLGKIGKVIVSKDTITIINGGGDQAAVDARIAELKTQMLEAGEREMAQMERRIAKLAGGVAIIRVGAASEVELHEKKARVEDAVAATKAAVEDGVVAGGGVALLRASQKLRELYSSKSFLNEARKLGYKLVADSMTVPLQTIAVNGGVNGEVVLNEVLRLSGENLNFGYNAATESYEDLVVSGVIDPVKVTKTALEQSISVSKMLISTECLALEVMDDKQMEAETDPSNMQY